MATPEHVQMLAYKYNSEGDGELLNMNCDLIIGPLLGQRQVDLLIDCYLTNSVWPKCQVACNGDRLRCPVENELSPIYTVCKLKANQQEYGTQMNSLMYSLSHD